MIARSEFLLALSLPAIAVVWVIADTSAQLISADRNIHSAKPVVQFVGEPEITATMGMNQYRAPTAICSSDRANDAAKEQLRSYVRSQVALQRLCQAGVKFTASLPKT